MSRRRIYFYEIKYEIEIPDNTTMSLVESPRFWNLLTRLERVEVGGGITPLFAAARLAVFESLLPSFTSHVGPPSCIYIYMEIN